MGNSGPSMAPNADTPVRDLTMNITARLGGLAAVLEDDAEWQSSSRSRSNALPGAAFRCSCCFVHIDNVRDPERKVTQGGFAQQPAG